MRVLVACLQGQARAGMPAYGFWRAHFQNGLIEAGCEFLEAPGLDWAESLSLREPAQIASWKSRAWQQTLEFTRREQGINLFLSYLYPDQIDLPAIREIQRLGIRCVNFFCDNIREFRKAPAEFGAFDLNWVPEFEALPMYAKAGFEYIHAPMPCWVPPALRTVSSQESQPPTFIGSADDLRRTLLAEAVKYGANLRVHGAGWAEQSPQGGAPHRRSRRKIIANQFQTVKRHGLGGLATRIENRLRPRADMMLDDEHVGGPVSGSDYPKLIRESMVSIGINRVTGPYIPVHRPRSYSRLRDIEAPMLGACYLTEWTEGLPQLYDIGAEIETYRDAKELAAKLDQLVRDSNKRRSLRVAGQQRALREHSIPGTITRIADALGLPLKKHAGAI